jgi:hypothetical protein
MNDDERLECGLFASYLQEASGLCRKAFHLDEHARAHAITSAERLSAEDTKRRAVEAITGWANSKANRFRG